MINKTNIEERLVVLDGDIDKVNKQLINLEQQRIETVGILNALQGAKQQCVNLVKELHNDEDQSSGSSDDS